MCGVAILLAVASMPAAIGTSLIGTGAHNCAEYLSAVHNDAETDRAMTQWALGYISGTVLSMPKQKREFDLSALKPDMVRNSLRVFCTEKPSSEFSDAVDHLLFSLPTRPAD
jgi:hypothetical protein